MWCHLWISYSYLWSLNSGRFCCGSLYCQSDCKKCNSKLLTKSAMIHDTSWNRKSIRKRIYSNFFSQIAALR
ncbi:hypothetical protein M758_6G145700 [Ceratodon purpureus]|uniref:Secreted protein n=1 Tax=Ceratodon purpureus TaxID=3225 RepID=A0A8T0HIB4_CERPU|nr:hypothetical protein KC19_6G151500 [Ceratodon purpureus]KAG0614024.1 hypothetical protein M758_6G145700 [Ceratodon purpureus]